MEIFLSPGERLEKAINILDFTQKEFSQRICLSPQAINGYVKGKAIPDFMALLIEKTFGISKTWLLTGEGEMWYNPPVSTKEGLERDMFLIRKILKDEELRPLMDKVVDLKKADKERLYGVLKAFLG